MKRTYVTRGGVDRAIAIGDLRAMARRRLPAFAFEYLEGGAEDETTLHRNRSVLDEIAFVPRALERCGAVDIAAPVLGGQASAPLIIAPTGFAGLFWRDGDLALARAAAAFGIPFAQSAVSNARLEDVATIAGLRHWMQLYMFRSRDFMESLIARAANAGCEALIVTVDGAALGNREWDRRNYRGAFKLTPRARVDAALHPAWLWRVMRGGAPSFVNIIDALPPDRRTMQAAADWSRREVDPDFDWTGVAWLRESWKGKLVIKGLLAADDVRRAVEAGADGVVLSNHGGRQLDGAIATIEALPAAVAAAQRRVAIIVDSGFRRGADVVKAMALGADAIMIGRATLYGLAAGGEAGASRALAILAEEIARALALLGRPRWSLLDRAVLARCDRLS